MIVKKLKLQMLYCWLLLSSIVGPLAYYDYFYFQKCLTWYLTQHFLGKHLLSLALTSYVLGTIWLAIPLAWLILLWHAFMAWFKVWWSEHKTAKNEKEAPSSPQNKEVLN